MQVYTPKRNTYDSEKRNSLRKLLYGAAAVGGAAGLGALVNVACNKLEKIADEPVSYQKEIIGTVIEVAPLDLKVKATNSDYSYAIIKEDSTGIRYKYGTYDYAKNLLERVKRGNRVRLEGKVYDEDLKRAGKDAGFVVPVTNADIKKVK